MDIGREAASVKLLIIIFSLITIFQQIDLYKSKSFPPLMLCYLDGLAGVGVDA